MRSKVVFVACLSFAVVLDAQSSGAFTSPDPADTTEGLNVLFFGNSFTFSSSNSLVNNPSYGGARGVPELVRQVAIAAGQPAPFVKMVFHNNRGFDHHVSPLRASLPQQCKKEVRSWTQKAVNALSTSVLPQTQEAAAS